MTHRLARLRTALLAAASAAALAACAEAAAAPTPPAGDPPSDVAADVLEFAELANEHRARKGCRPLAWHVEAGVVAQGHSADMVARGFFSHVNPDGRDPFERLRAAGVPFSSAAENIAAGYPSAEAVLQAWLASPGHRTNLENCRYTRHGVGLVGTTWTHVLLTP
jgi:uncharacterized protein YkwD